MNEKDRNPSFDSPMSVRSASHSSPYLASAENSPNVYLMSAEISPNIFGGLGSSELSVRPTTSNNTILSPPFEALWRQHGDTSNFPKPAVSDNNFNSPEVGELNVDDLSHELFDKAAYMELKTRMKRSMMRIAKDPASPYHTQGMSNSQSGVDATFHDVSQSPSTLRPPADPPVIPNIGPSTPLLKEGILPPPELGFISQTSVTPWKDQPKLGFQEILRQQVAQRRADSSLLPGPVSLPITSRTASTDNQSQPTPESVLNQPPMPPVPSMRTPSSVNVFPQVIEKRLAIGPDIVAFNPGISSFPSINNHYSVRSFIDPLPRSKSDSAVPDDRSSRSLLASRPAGLRKYPSDQPRDAETLARRDHFGLPTSLRKQTPGGRERRQAQTAAKRQRGIGTDDKELPKEATLDAESQRMTSNIAGSASDQPTVQVIGHTMPLVTIIEHLVNQGCADVSSQLKNIDEHSRYSGSLSDVYQARWPDGSLVAVKCLKTLSNSDVPPGKLLKHTARELYMWSRASHPNILKLHGLAMVRGKLAMIAPWMEHSSLLAYIRARPQVDRCCLCAQVAVGLSYMHDLGLVHGDVKGNNVVVSEDGTPKLTDFGSTTMVQEFAIAFTATQTVNYSIRWAAPELFQSQSPCFESDVYSFAKTVLEALTGDIPHKGLTDFATMRHVGVEGKLPDRPMDHLPPRSRKGDGLWDMLARCWDVEPTKRPKISEVCEFMNDVTQEDLQLLE